MNLISLIHNELRSLCGRSMNIQTSGEGELTEAIAASQQIVDFADSQLPRDMLKVKLFYYVAASQRKAFQKCGR